MRQSSPSPFWVLWPCAVGIDSSDLKQTFEIRPVVSFTVDRSFCVIPTPLMTFHTVENLPRLLSYENRTNSVSGETTPRALPLPRLTYYLPSPEYREGSTVLILPGGGYGKLATGHEGHRPAQFLASQGIAAGVLEYRHAPERHPAPLQDACQALGMLKDEAARHDLDPSCLGVLGFSAGGHLAGCLACRLPRSLSLWDREAWPEVECSPAFAILVYPVVTFIGPDTHAGSCRNLLGENASLALREQLSLEQAVNPETCPMLLIHGQADKRVLPSNSMALYSALTEAGVPASLLLYEGAEHGFGLGQNHPWGREMVAWIGRRTDFIRKNEASR